jgi:hypothetical protein
LRNEQRGADNQGAEDISGLGDRSRHGDKIGALARRHQRGDILDDDEARRAALGDHLAH